MDVDEFVKRQLENTTVEQLIDIARNGVEIPDDDDMQAMLENAFIEHAKEILLMNYGLTDELKPRPLVP